MLRRIGRNVWPDQNSSRTLFMLASIAAGLGCLAAACTTALMLSGPQPAWGLAAGTGACFQSVALLLAAGLMIPAVAREPRAAPRALAWGTLSVAALVGTAVVLAMMAGEPDAFVLCSVTCIPLILGPGALALYHGMKSRGEALPDPPFIPYAPPPLALPSSGSVSVPVVLTAELPAPPSTVVQNNSPDASPDDRSPALADAQQQLDPALPYPTLDLPPAGVLDTPGEAEARQASCPSCGAKLDVPKGGGYVFCFQCGSQVSF